MGVPLDIVGGGGNKKHYFVNLLHQQQKLSFKPQRGFFFCNF